MALNTPVPRREVGNTTEQLLSKKGVARQIVVDTTKKTVAVMDGETYGGNPLAREAIKIISASPNLKINGGAEASLASDITITVLPGYMATGFRFVENPEGEPEGKYLEITYSDSDGSSSIAYVDAALLVDTYKAGVGILIAGDNTISVDSTAISAGAFAADGGGLEVTEEGRLAVKAGDGIQLDNGAVAAKLGAGLKIVDGAVTLDIDENSLLKVTEAGKLALKSLVSTDADNILAEGSDNGVYMPGDLGSLGDEEE